MSRPPARREAAGLLGEEPGEADRDRVAANLEAVRRRILSAGGDPAAITVVAVTKGFTVAAVRCALALGLAEIGENYADELLEKARRVAELDSKTTARWHFLGAVQGNKVARLAGVAARFEAVDRLVEGERIARLAPGASVLVEVDFTRRPERGGVPPSEAPGLVESLSKLPLSVDGLMTVAPDRAGASEAFGALAALGRRLGLAELSMGMSEDLEEAVAAGATSLRLGRALFGPRPSRAPRVASERAGG